MCHHRGKSLGLGEHVNNLLGMKGDLFCLSFQSMGEVFVERERERKGEREKDREI